MADPADQSVLFLARGNPSGAPTALRIEHKEAVLVREFVVSGDIKSSSKAAGMPVAAAREALARPEIAQYLEEKLLEQAGAAGVTREAVLYAIGELLQNPNREATQAHLKALDIAAKILKMVQPNLHLHQQVAADSQFKEMDDSQFYAELNKRMAYRDTPAAAQTPAIPVTEIEHHA
jgi:molybdenum-dependent DNA-binding transcriptional regulator ModE